jgi:Flp pilus assembly pilin Flp
MKKRNDFGASMVEYAILVALIAVIAIVALGALGREIHWELSHAALWL